MSKSLAPVAAGFAILAAMIGLAIMEHAHPKPARFTLCGAIQDLASGKREPVKVTITSDSGLAFRLERPSSVSMVLCPESTDFKEFSAELRRRP